MISLNGREEKTHMYIMKHKKKQLIACCLILILGLADGCGSSKSSKKETTKIAQTETETETESETPAQITTLAPADLVESVNMVKENLEDMVGVNDVLSEQDRNQMFDSLIADINAGKADGKEVYYRLKSIVAAIKCAHLQINFIQTNPYKDKLIPLNFMWLGDQLVICNTDSTNKKYLGYSVNNINGFTPDELVKKYATIESYETESGSKASLENILFVSDLAYLGVMKDDDKEVTLSITNRDGKTEELKAQICKYGEIKEYYSLADMDGASKEIPISYKVRSESNMANYAYEPDQNNGVMYFQYLSCQEISHNPMDGFFKEMMDTMQKNDADYKTFVIDVRWNGGGNRNILSQQLRKYKDYLNTKNIAVIIGKNTYSAGFQVVEDCLELFDHVKTYGEPTGQAISNYTEINTTVIPKLGMNLITPTVLDQLPKLAEKYSDVKNSIMPDVAVSQSLEDLLNGKDSIYQAIIENK